MKILDKTNWQHQAALTDDAPAPSAGASAVPAGAPDGHPGVPPVPGGDGGACGGSADSVEDVHPFAIVLDANDGTEIPDTRQIEAVPAPGDDAPALPPNGFERPGFAFSCWSTDPDGQGKSFPDEAPLGELPRPVDGVLVLYAQWAPVSGEGRFIRELVRVLVAIAVVVVICCVLAYIFPVFHIHSWSMEPTILTGEYCAAFRFGEVKQGEAVVVPYNDEGDYLVKHVAAVEGQRVEINRDGELLVDGAVFKGSYGTTIPTGSASADLPLVVPEGCVFLVNDNREASNDSRNVDLGCVSKGECVGIALMRFGFFGQAGR